MNRLAVSVLALMLTLFTVFGIYFIFDYSVKPVSAEVNQDFYIIIDPGHGGEDGGTSSSDGTLEKDINLSIARYLESMLNSIGYKTIMTRSTDNQLGDISLSTIRQRKISDIKSRLEITENNSNSILISIHQNYYSSSIYNGTQVFYSPKSPESKILADSIQHNIVQLLQHENKRTTKQVGTNIYLLYNCHLPAVMVECGFMSNPEEAEKLKNNEYQKQIAFSIICGIQNYLEDKDG